MAVDDSKYAGLFAGLSGSGGGGAEVTELRSPIGGPVNYGAIGPINVGNDNGRGPGTPGGRGTGATGRTIGGIGPADMYTEEDVAKILRGMPPERIAAIQRQMQTIGLLPEDYKSYGFVENTMRSGFAELLEASNMRGDNYISTLNELTSAGSGKDTMEEVRKEMARKRASLEASFDTSLRTMNRSDPASVRQTAEAAFRQALGRKPKKDELERFVGTFLGNERESQQRVFDAQDRLEGADRKRTLNAFDAEASSAMGAGGGDGGEGGSEAEILWERVQRMIADSPYEIKPGKRTRSRAEQERLYAEYKAGRGPLAAKPGTSKHGDGRANDLKYSSPAARKWALENAHKYGLHFPIYNPKLSRSRDESWHVEVLGGAGAGHAVGDGHDHAAMTGGGQAPISENVIVQQQDMGAQAIEFARKSNPVETAAYDIGGQFNNFLSILQKGVGA